MRRSSAGSVARPWFHSSARILIAVLAVVALCVLSSVNVGIRLLAGTVLALSGNNNPTGESMRTEFDGYFDPDSPNYGFGDYEFEPVPWRSVFWAPGTTFDAGQTEGTAAVDLALRETLRNKPGSKVVLVGYSSGANAVIKEIRILDAERGTDADTPLTPTPTPDQVSFIVFGSPNRPNGGIYNRIPGLYVPIIGITGDGANPQTDYDLTDISWRWDPISDFPLYPLNPFAAVNSAFAFYYLHSFYYEANIHDVDPTFSGTAPAPDGTKYITITPEHLPLLQPFYDMGLPTRPLDALEPVLTELVELSYDRTIPVWETTPLRLLPPPEHLLAALPKLRDALEEGVDILTGNQPAEVEDATADQLKSVEPPSVSASPWRAPRIARELSTTEQTAAEPAPDPVQKPGDAKESLTAPARELADRLDDAWKELPKLPRVKVPNRADADRPDAVRRSLRELRDALSHNNVRPNRQSRVSESASNG